MLAVRLDHFTAVRNRNPGADSRDLAAMEDDGAVDDGRPIDRMNRGSDDGHGVGLHRTRNRVRPESLTGTDDKSQANQKSSDGGVLVE